ncbi:MAG: glycosyltransferase [Actinobacteria bacterium]|nr:glycosyltransferase [Actinomycetota bacterium]MBU1942933.1 glycosyltransferase [Actinomycetota bacterium]MBU2687313.1 glycosyltransferase [Actinomycetota bacterium]
MRPKVPRVLAAAYAVAGGAFWLAQAYAAIRAREVPFVEDMPADGLTLWPKVSVIMTACDEAEGIEEGVRSRLADDYPDLEAILVDDRSTDDTGRIIDALAGEDPRVKAVHVTELPEGWLGKVNAMRAGLAEATGDWVLFSDADVRVEPGTMRRVIGFAESHGIDHLPVFPGFERVSLPLDIGISATARGLVAAGRIWKVPDPDSGAAAGSGSFNLVRRSALEATRGLEWIRLEVADDVGLGLMLKESGARQMVANGRGFVSVRFYGSIMEGLRGGERAGFTSIGNFSLARLTAMGTALLLLELSPFALMLSRSKVRRALGVTLLGVDLAASASIADWSGHPPWLALFQPLAIPALTFAFIRTGILGKLRGGIYWRGTFYPTEMLKPGRRFLY